MLWVYVIYGWTILGAAAAWDIGVWTLAAIVIVFLLSLVSRRQEDL